MCVHVHACGSNCLRVCVFQKIDSPEVHNLVREELNSKLTAIHSDRMGLCQTIHVNVCVYVSCMLLAVVMWVWLG